MKNFQGFLNKFRKFTQILLVLALLVMPLIACSKDTAQPQTEATTQSNNSSTAEVSNTQSTNNTTTVAPAFPLTLTDATNQSITLQEEPKRIVSLVPSNTEILFALGVGSKVVGVTKWDNYPAEVSSITKVGDMKPNGEVIIGLKPDLVLAAKMNGESIDALRKLGLTVFVIPDAKDIAQVYQNIETIAKITGVEEKGKEVIAKMEEEKQAIVEKVKDLKESEKKKVWVEISPDPDIYSAGKGTFWDELISLAGGINVAHELEGWPKVSAEKVVEYNPDVILITYGSYVQGATEAIKVRNGYEVISAVKNNQIFDLNADLVNRPGPRLMDGLKEIAKRIYPDKFN